MFTPFCHILILCLEKVFLQCVLQSRALSGADAINALRPFYFAVHPDFFGQHPKEREVNENSLKRLNGYLENLQKPGFRSFKPTQLTFYVREREPNSSNVQESFSSSVMGRSFTQCASVTVFSKACVHRL
uniref:DUF4460 domain-containing protein n=1 Tax=Strix occidentalis caurina TaxID=311401 RepID=A0A8D0KPT1_STROC